MERDTIIVSIENDDDECFKFYDGQHDFFKMRENFVFENEEVHSIFEVRKHLSVDYHNYYSDPNEEKEIYLAEFSLFEFEFGAPKHY